MAEVAVCRRSEIQDGERRIVSCGEAEIGVFAIGAELIAWHNECAHRGGPVCRGRTMPRVLEPVAEDRTVRAMAYDEASQHLVCPWHGYEYDIRTGAHPGNPVIRLRPAEVQVRDGIVYVRP